MNDILPPRRPQQSRPTKPTQSVLPPVEPSQPTPPPDEPPKQRRSRKKIAAIIAGAIVLLLVILGAGAFAWYQNALQPVAPNDKNQTRVTIVAGSSPSEIGQLLEQKQLIRSSTAFDIFTRITATRSRLQAGTYRLSPSESTSQIVDHMVSGHVEDFTVTFYPGATLTDATDTPANKKTDVQTVLRRAGFSDEEILAAFEKNYDHPLFTSKPAGTSLEGYVYGETYNFASDATVEDILTRTFDEYYKVLQENKLIPAFKRQGLSLYQAITLASIVQREVPKPADQKQVAQVFYKRLAIGMELGSDITAYYGADKIGAKRSVAVDTPYNTRIHKGLPPGPIASPGLSALQAVAHPAEGDYLYFLSGDDDVTYFARTNDEHEKNIRDHCKIKCAVQ